jgi:hypothetical protein
VRAAAVISDGSIKSIARLMLVNFNWGGPASSLLDELSAYDRLLGMEGIESRFGNAVKSELPPSPGTR